MWINQQVGFVGTAAILVLLVACANDEAAAPRVLAEVQVSDSAGVRLVGTPVEQATRRLSWTVDPEPAVRLGEASDGPPELLFNSVSSAAVVDGVIGVADQQELRFFTSDGELIATARRVSASGPEGMSAPSIFQDPERDGFVALDGLVPHAGFFGTDGEVTDEFRWEAESELGVARGPRVWSGRSLVLFEYTWPLPGDTEPYIKVRWGHVTPGDPQPVTWWDEDFRATQHVPPSSLRDLPGLLGTVPTAEPLTWPPTLTAREGAVFLVTRNATEVVRLDAEGLRQAVYRILGGDRPVRDADVEAEVRGRLDRVGVSGSDARAYERWVLGLPRPEVRNRWVDGVAGPNGEFWARVDHGEEDAPPAGRCLMPRAWRSARWRRRPVSQFCRWRRTGSSGGRRMSWAWSGLSSTPSGGTPPPDPDLTGTAACGRLP